MQDDNEFELNRNSKIAQLRKWGIKLKVLISALKISNDATWSTDPEILIQRSYWGRKMLIFYEIVAQTSLRKHTILSCPKMVTMFPNESFIKIHKLFNCDFLWLLLKLWASLPPKGSATTTMSWNNYFSWEPLKGYLS